MFRVVWLVQKEEAERAKVERFKQEAARVEAKKARQATLRKEAGLVE